MLVIGIVGGVASGKSVVAEQLQTCGAVVLDADHAAHEVLKQPDVKLALRERWGEQVFDQQGEVDRSAVARIVFEPSEKGQSELKFLEQVSHPRIRALLEDRLAQLRTDGATAAVLDAAVMVKAGWNNLCDHVIFVETPRETRIVRAKTRGWSEQEFDRREAAQETLQTKWALSDVIIDNSGTPAQTQAQVERFWQSVTS